MTRDPRSLPRAARRRVKRAAARLGGVDEVRARLTETKTDLRRARQERDRARQQRDRAREELARSRERAADLTARLEEGRAETREAQREARALDTRRAAAVEKVTAFGFAYRGARAAALGKRRPGVLGPAPGRAPEGPERREIEEELAWVHARGHIARALSAGSGLEAGVEAYVRAAQGADRMAEARALTQWLHDHEPTRTAGRLGTGLIAHRMGLSTFAWQRLSLLPDDVWLRHAPGEYVLLAGTEDPEQAARAVRRALAQPGELSSRAWFDLTRRAMGLDLGALCTDLAERFASAAESELGSGDLETEEADALRADVTWVQRWAPRIADGPARPRPATPGALPFAVLGYDQPDPRNTSSNIGDYVQTVASLGHLVRHAGLRFEEDELGRLAAELAQRVPDRLRVDSPERLVSLHQVDRDASSYSSVPDGTWLLAFGWYAHKLGGVRHDFPFPGHLRPIYISFHLNKRALLTDEAVEHLREHAPIGCRDHSTVDVLLGLGIPAFFSGCLTTTVGYVQEQVPRRSAEAATRYVDVPAPKGGSRVRNERPDVLHADLVTNLRSAVATLEEYATEVGTVVTGRLHAYLPARTLGCTVDFTPGNPADIRFAGLAPLTDEQLEEMGRTIADLLEPVVGAILAGEEEDHVRRVWAEVTAEHVAAARERHERHVDLPAHVDVDEAVATIRARRVDVPREEAGPVGDELRVVLALDGNLKEQFLVVVDGLVEHASRPLHLDVLVREHEQADFDRAAALFPTVSFSWFPCDEVTYGDITAMVPHITISTMDRLLLPELLTEVDRVVYHDIDALPVADIAPLHDIDLAGHPLAARDLEASVMQSGYSNIFVPASLPGLPAGAGSELIRRETARHPFDFVGFNAGIMVLDLARMRADDFCRRFLPYADNFGMHDQHILNVYAGSDRLALAPEWNARPSQEEVVDPRIIHWAGGQKPWGELYVAHVDAWRRHEEELRRREATLATKTQGGPVDISTRTRESL